MRADADSRLSGQIGDQQLAGAADLGHAIQLGAQRLRYRGPGVDEIDVHAARAVVTRRLHLPDVTPVPIPGAGPADAPGIHFADAFGSVLAEEPGERLIAQATSRLERVGEVMLPMVGRFLAE